MRIKPPTKAIESDPEALEAFNKMSEADRLAANALAAYHRYSGGTGTGQKHHKRYEEYRVVADEWRRQLDVWLHRRAGRLLEDYTTDRNAAELAREDGRNTWLRNNSRPNPHHQDTFLAFCWQAGYAQDVRSLDELERDWRRKQAA